MSELTRPRDIASMRAALAKLHSEDSLAAAARFEARPSDVFIVTYPKCGTTWMQQIVHGLRSAGDMDFAEICAAVPWLETAWDLGIDPARSRFSPRAIKTHATWEQVPKGGRYIYVTRDPCDVALSFYRFFEGWMFEPGSISLARFVEAFFFEGSRSGRYWDHLRGWWAQREAAHTLMLSFEHMRRDLPGVVARVAAFMGMELDSNAGVIALATEQARFEFMRAHGGQFDDHLLREARDAACGLPPGRTSKLRAGEVGQGREELSDALRERFAATWKAELGALGFDSYAQLERALDP